MADVKATDLIKLWIATSQSGRNAARAALGFGGSSTDFPVGPSPTPVAHVSASPLCVWRGETYRIVEKLSEWHDYTRRGRMARNMMPQHAAVAAGRGSWGVGRDYFRVRVEGGQVFDIYYDRAPKGSGARKGAWFLYREVSAGDEAGD